MKIEIDWNSDRPAMFEGDKSRDYWIVCDTCNKAIKDISMGIAVFESVVELPAQTSVQFFHKGACDPVGKASWDIDHLFQLFTQSSDASTP